MVRELYGLKGAESAWEPATQKLMIYIVLQPCMDDANVWIISAVDTSAIKYSDVSMNKYSNNLPIG